MNMIRTLISLEDLRHGMTVDLDGRLHTVDSKEIKRSEFMGLTFLGDPWRKGITRVVFKVPTARGYRYE